MSIVMSPTRTPAEVSAFSSSPLVITGFVLAAEILEGLTVGRGRRAIQQMLDFLPRTASVVRGDTTEEVATQSIKPGEIVLIRPGSRIPVDGKVTSGHSFVEQAAITGEPIGEPISAFFHGQEAEPARSWARSWEN